MIVDASGSNASVTGAIRQAARMTGADFQYLLATAQVESNLNPNAKVSTSSAHGLFQFIEQTWLATLKERGPALGYGPYANAIARLPSGRYVVTEPGMHNRVINLRSDPTANALMAGAFTRANAAKLAARLGRDPIEGELYIAHFLGPTGASRLIDAAQSRPLTPAVQVFPGAARANPGIFYDRQGRARTTSEVYRVLVGRYDVARAAPAKPTAVAAVDSKPAKTAVAPDPAALAETYAAVTRLSVPPPPPSPSPPAPSARASNSGSVFHSLFSTGARPEAVAPMVSALWSAPATPPVAAAAGRAVRTDRGMLDLFQDRAPEARALSRGRG